MIEKINGLMTKTIKAQAIRAAQAMAAFCPSMLQTTDMLDTKVMKEAIPMVDTSEWEKYITMPKQEPAPTTTEGRIQWWKQRIASFPKLAPVAISYLLAPKSAAQAERSFSCLGHIRTRLLLWYAPGFTQQQPACRLMIGSTCQILFWLALHSFT